MSFQKQVKLAIDAYINDWKNVVESYIDNHYENSLEITSEPHIQEAIYEDLLDKNFTKEEINEILDSHPSQVTSYKFLAYFILLYHDWTTSNELMNLIKNHLVLNLDEFSEDDINNIVLQRNNVNY